MQPAFSILVKIGVQLNSQNTLKNIQSPWTIPQQSLITQITVESDERCFNFWIYHGL